MYRIIFIFLLLLSPLSQGAATAGASNAVISNTNAGKVAEELSQLSAAHLYNMDDSMLSQTLLVILDNNDQIKSVRIDDGPTKEVFLSFYRDESDHIISGTAPESLNQYQKATSPVVYNGALIGYLEIRFESGKERSEIDLFTKSVGLLAVIFIIFVIALAFIFKMLSEGLKSNQYLAFGSKAFARLIIFALSIFVTLSFAGGWFMLKYNEINIKNRAEDSFNQYLTTLANTLGNGNEIRTGTFKHIFAKNEFQRNYFKMVGAQERDDSEEYYYYKHKMDALWDRYREFGSNLSKVIVDENYNITYLQGSAIDLSTIDTGIGSSFSRAWAGYSSLLPIQKRVDPSTGDESYQLLFATPVHDKVSGEVMAVAIIEVKNNHYLDLGNYHFSESGEMMAYSGKGELVSTPRFTGKAKHKKQNSEFIIRMLEEAKEHGFDNKSAELHEITDYRGKTAYVMLHWVRELNTALVAKIDGDELLEDYHRFKNGLAVIIIAMVAFTVPCMLFTLYAGNRSNRSLKESRREIIDRLGHAAEFKDNETALHIVRMSRYTEVLARNHGMPNEWIDLLGNAAPMHDIGKIGIPDAILQKPGKLTAEEWEIMKKHPKIGADIIGYHVDSDLLAMAREIALCHHEKWDGTGYPEGLSGEHIPLSARIIAIADVFDALTSERPYKRAWRFDDAVGLIVSESGSHFDPKLVKVFKESLTEFKIIMNKYKDDQIEGDAR